MSNISAALVKELRDETNLGMMDCKNALKEVGGDKDKAVILLRERGMAIAGKKASRTANEGLINAEVLDGGKTGVIIEVNCETDFVVKNEVFQNFVGELLESSKSVGDNELAETAKDDVVAAIAEIGENIVVRRNTKFETSGPGTIASYIHLGGKVGVLLEVGCEKDETSSAAAFKEVVKDVTLHITASNPQYLNREEVPADVLQQEREIYAKQVEGKPAEIIGKIVDGKLEKFYGQSCLVEQPFVKDSDQSVTDLLTAAGKALGDNLSIRRFVRYQVGA